MQPYLKGRIKTIVKSIEFLVSDNETEEVYLVKMSGINSKHMDLRIAKEDTTNLEEDVTLSYTFDDNWCKLSYDYIFNIRRAWLNSCLIDNRLDFLPMIVRSIIFEKLFKQLTNV